jgi:DNA-directed RNA polymerase specialized sigma24 family protein
MLRRTRPNSTSRPSRSAETASVVFARQFPTWATA